jgi:ferrous iron transport protein A
LGELKPGDQGRIVRIDTAGTEGPAAELAARLMEMGLLEGSAVTLVHEAPFGGDPIAVRVRGALIALRRGEANLVWVERVS